MEHPKHVIEAAENAAVQFPNDSQQAIDSAVGAIQAMPDYLDFVNSLVRRAIAELVYQARHQANVAIKKQAGEYGGPAKVVVGDSPAVQTVMTNYHSYFIAGTTLGLIHGKDLDRMANGEDLKADSHRFNSRLLRKLRTIVPPESRVAEVVTNHRLKEIFQEVKRESSK